MNHSPKKEFLILTHFEVQRIISSSNQDSILEKLESIKWIGNFKKLQLSREELMDIRASINPPSYLDSKLINKINLAIDKLTSLVVGDIVEIVKDTRNSKSHAVIGRVINIVEVDVDFRNFQVKLIDLDYERFYLACDLNKTKNHEA